MTDINHGHWMMYQPASPPPNVPLQTIFARRNSDGVDWYDYVHSGSNFDPASVKMTLRDNVVYAAATDVTLLFPEDMDILEVFDAQTSDPQQEFGRRIYDPATGTFSDPVSALEAMLGGR